MITAVLSILCVFLGLFVARLLFDNRDLRERHLELMRYTQFAHRTLFDSLEFIGEECEWGATKVLGGPSERAKRARALYEFITSKLEKEL